MAKITMREAISQALMEEMDRDPAVFIMGEEVGVWGGTYAVTKGFYDKYGPERIKDTPIAENAIIGAAIGAARYPLRTSGSTTLISMLGFEIRFATVPGEWM
jgi:pyruvate dehydrogenase E1 component beta subunit